MKEHTIDATNRALGRVASEVATILMGKDTPEFRRNIAPKVSVTIVNASKLKISKRKADGKIYQRYSGYPGGRREWTMAKEIEKDGHVDIFTRAVRGMLPSNKLRPEMLKNLTVED